MRFSKHSALRYKCLVGGALALSLLTHRAASAAWTPRWLSLGGFLTTGPAVVGVPGSYRLDVFARGQGPDFSLWHSVINGNSFGAWEKSPGAPPVAGGMTSRPAALYQPGAAGGARWNVVSLAGDGNLYYTYYQDINGGWRGPWLALPNGVLTSAASLTLNSNNRIDVWAAGQGPQKGVWHTTIEAATNPPTLPGGWDGSVGAPTAPLGVKGPPAAFSRTPGQIDIIVQSADDFKLWHRNYDGTGWSQWVRIDNFLDYATVDVGLASTAAGQLDIYARGSDGNAYHSSFSGRQPGTLTWDLGPGAPAGLSLSSGVALSAVSTQAGIVDIVGLASDNSLYSRRSYKSAPVATSGSQKEIAHLSATGDGFVPIPYPTSDLAAPQDYKGVSYLSYTSFFENGSIAIPPNGKAPNGGCPANTRTFVAVGSFGSPAGTRGDSAFLQTDSLGTSGKTKNVTNKLFDATGISPWLPGINADTMDNNRYTFGTDAATVRASTGELVHLRLGYDRSNLPLLGSGGFFWRSRDCGATWAQWPSSFPDVATGPGLDRPELFADPWSSNVYFSAATENGATIQRMSLSDAHPQFTHISADGALTGWTPYMMATTRTGRLFVFNCEGAQPTLQYTPRGAMNALSLTTIAVSADQCRSGYGGFSGMDGSQSVIALASSVDGDSVLVAFPIMQTSNGVARQMFKAYVVWVSADGAQTSKTEALGSPISSQSATGSVWQLAVVPSDRTELPPADGTTTALFYWQESTTSPAPNVTTDWGGAAFGNVSVMGLAVRDNDLTGPRVQLSASALLSSKQGDFVKGSFFFDPARPSVLNYLALWNIGGRIAGNVVTVPRTL